MIRRMKVNRLVRAGATCPVAAFAVSCGGGDGENRSVSGERSRGAAAASSASPSCSKASIRWGKVTVGTKLIAVSQLVTVEDGQDVGWVKLSPRHVRTVTSRIEASGGRVPTRRVFASLASMKCGIVPEQGKWFREAYDLVCPGARA
jgi:hypothetical protein